MTTTLLFIALLVSLWLGLRAAAGAFLPALRVAVERERQNEGAAEVTAADLQTYLNAMEANFKTARIPFHSKPPRKSRTPKPKAPSQNPINHVPTPGPRTAKAPSQADRSPSPLKSKTKPTTDTATVANRVLSLADSPHISSPITLSESSDRSSHLMVKTPSANIGVNLRLPLTAMPPKSKQTLLNLYLTPIHLVVRYLRMALLKVREISTYAAAIFTRSKPPPSSLSRPPATSHPITAPPKSPPNKFAASPIQSQEQATLLEVSAAQVHHFIAPIRSP